MTPELQAGFDRANQAQESYVSMAESGARLPQMLRDAVSERMANSPIGRQRDEAAANVLTSPARSRSQLAEIVQGGTILSPTQQQQIMTQQRASDLVPLMSLNDLLQAQLGGVDTAVNAGLGAYETLLGAQQARAQMAQQSAEGAWNRAMQQAQLDLSRQKAAQASAPSAIEQAILDLFAGINRDQTTTSGEGITGPQFTPREGNGAMYEDDETGDVWYFSDGRWVQVSSGANNQSQTSNSPLSMYLSGGRSMA